MRSLGLVALLAACAGEPEPEPEPPFAGANVLLVVLDETGIDKIGAYGVPSAPPTPRIDALAASGVRFANAYATPGCATTRAAILTGRYPRRSGFGTNLFPHSGLSLDLGEVSIAELLAHSDHGYTAEAVGKWHLADLDTPDVLDHALKMGFAHHRGTVENLAHPSVDEPTDYFHWEKLVDGEAGFVDRYALTDTTDDAVARAAAMPEPWLLWVGYHAAHEPLHVPPGSDVDPEAGSRELFDAMVTALDAEVGRLLDGLPPGVLERTLILVIGDNGTIGKAVAPPLDHQRRKGTVFEGGVHVPLVVAGPEVSTGESDALVHAVDLFATIAAVAEVDPAVVLPIGRDIDGLDLRAHLAEPATPSAREVVLSERFDHEARPSVGYDDRTLRDHRYKLIRRDDEPDLFFDLWATPYDEGPDLLAGGLDPQQQEAYEALGFELDRLVAELSAAP